MIAAAPPVAIVILAAGGGSRMRSALPKPLHRVGGLSLLGHVLALAATAAPERVVVVVGEGKEAVAAEARAGAPSAAIVEQPVRRGTGDAVRCALPALEGFSGIVVVLYADTPFLSPGTLDALRTSGAPLSVLGFDCAAPGGYGRLVLDGDGALDRVVEAADATDAERAIGLCNAGAMAFEAEALRRLLPRLTDANAQAEYYLTDLVALARAEGLRRAVIRCAENETIGVNTRADLARAESLFQAGARAAALDGGATLVAPETVFFSHDTRLGRDVVVGPCVAFGLGVRVEDAVEIGAFCHLEGCLLQTGASVGPFARLRAGAVIGSGARIGNFVEVKNAALGPGAKAGHLAYLGDAVVGAGANIGAGVITCNFDGFAKHLTRIGADAFIGSNAALVAPLDIGAGAYVGSGSTITEDVAPGALALARARQTHKPGFAARLRARLAARRDAARGKRV